MSNHQFTSGRGPDGKELVLSGDIKFSSKVFEILDKLPSDFFAKLNEGSGKDYGALKRDVMSKQPLFLSHESSLKDSHYVKNFKSFPNSNLALEHTLKTNQSLPSSGQVFPISQSSSHWEHDSLSVKRKYSNDDEDDGRSQKNSTSEKKCIFKEEKLAERTSAKDKDHSESQRKVSNTDPNMEKQKQILSKIWALKEQKKKLEAQRDSVIASHKGNFTKIQPILEENYSLISEVDNQVDLLNKMVQSLNTDASLPIPHNQSEKSQKLNTNVENLHPSKLPKRKTEVEEPKGRTKFLKPHEETLKLSRFNERKSTSSEYRKEKKSSTASDKQSTEPRSTSRWEDDSFSTKLKESKLSNSSNESEYARKYELRDSPPCTHYKADANKHRDHSGKKVDSNQSNISNEEIYWCRDCNFFSLCFGDHLRHFKDRQHLINSKQLSALENNEEGSTKFSSDSSDSSFQGTEFLHASIVYSCSLCKSGFIHYENEVRRHLKSDFHLKSIRDYISKNTSYQVNYYREKLAAYVKYISNKENPALNKNDESKDIAEKFDGKSTSENKHKIRDSLRSSKVEDLKSTSLESSKSNKVQSELSNSKSSRDFKDKAYYSEKSHSSSVRTDMEARGKSREDDSGDVAGSRNTRPICDSEKDLVKESTKYKSELTKSDDQSDNITGKAVPPDTGKISVDVSKQKRPFNLMIGKMPFLKKSKKPFSLKSKASKSSGQDINLSETEKKLVEFASTTEKTESRKVIESDSVLPSSIPANTEYITEIFKSDKETSFTKKIGPTLESVSNVLKDSTAVHCSPSNNSQNLINNLEVPIYYPATNEVSNNIAFASVSQASFSYGNDLNQNAYSQHQQHQTEDYYYPPNDSFMINSGGVPMNAPFPFPHPPGMIDSLPLPAFQNNYMMHPPNLYPPPQGNYYGNPFPPRNPRPPHPPFLHDNHRPPFMPYPSERPPHFSANSISKHYSNTNQTPSLRVASSNAGRTLKEINCNEDSIPPPPGTESLKGDLNEFSKMEKAVEPSLEKGTPSPPGTELSSIPEDREEKTESLVADINAPAADEAAHQSPSHADEEGQEDPLVLEGLELLEGADCDEDDDNDMDIE